MSKIAKNQIPVLDGVSVEINGQDIKTKGPKGELSLRVHDDVSVQMEDGNIRITPKSSDRQAKAMWGTMWSRVSNMVQGVHEGYVKNLEIKGVGYRANVQGKNLVLQLGYSHDVHYPIPEGVNIAVEKQTSVAISGIDKQKVGQVAAEIRSYRPPEPYKGKGVRYSDEYILRKEGKKK